MKSEQEIRNIFTDFPSVKIVADMFKIRQLMISSIVRRVVVSARYFFCVSRSPLTLSGDRAGSGIIRRDTFLNMVTMSVAAHSHF